MVVDAFVLPYPGRSVGVVFWNPRPVRRDRSAAGQERHELAVYAPAALSPGETADLLASYHASLGAALSEAERDRGAARVLASWWIFGTVAALLLAVRSLEFGAGPAFIALAAALTALPLGGAALPLAGRRYTLARRLGRRAGELVPVEGADARARERLSAVWQMARRQGGAELDQLRGLEAFCREQAWPAAARFYADRIAGTGGAGGTRLGSLRRRLRPQPDSGAAYAVVEMRAW